MSFVVKVGGGRGWIWELCRHQDLQREIRDLVSLEDLRRQQKRGRRESSGEVFVRGGGGCWRRRCGGWVAALTGKEVWVSLAEEGENVAARDLERKLVLVGVLFEWGEEASGLFDLA
ncbi:hypothetical protein Droror1_Dr00002423 [Drosera rotundifolia]